jgi:hypothetical protein
MSTDRTNADFTAQIAAALVKASAENGDVAREAADFVTSRGPSNTSGYLQPGATDVTDSLGGVSESSAGPAMPMDMADCPPGMDM